MILFVFLKFFFINIFVIKKKIDKYHKLLNI
jgi:hypothetical protein